MKFSPTRKGGISKNLAFIEFKMLIEYKMPGTKKSSDDDGGDLSRLEGGPDEIRVRGA